MTERVRIGMVVGETSGDILGAGLMSALRKHYPDAEFCGIGGPRMLALGFHSFFPMDRLAVMGLVEPLKRLPELLKIRRFLREHFTEHPPTVFIGVDAPDFNLTLEGHLKEATIPSVHYVSPTVWAWRQGRVHKIARSVDLMLTLFPFEAEFYQQHQVPVEFVGHHLADAFPLEVDQLGAREALGVPADARVITLMPGSRSGEVSRLGPAFLQAARHCLEQDPSLQFLLPAASPDRYRQLHHQLAEFTDLPITLIQGQSEQAMTAADAVLISSGTSALEALLLKRPMVVAYKVAPVSYAILSMMVKTEHISMPNLLAGRELVPEFLQQRAQPQALADALMHYFKNPEQTQALTETYDRIHRTLRQNASESAAAAVARLVEKR
ncbi:lipid-A-disaccharide synthase [Marinimicrobium sp. ABcell2]|uniref:lipid-A-disaccharide synthase n=1 Tax=Marinimicrobium sp. ABcell2 TaxID=3069751 RepID=UPI0027B1E8F9|nr:lipid-A-disaccharide synthase [Marinimicrobium sp. ABcell2]MDQ2075337.1 lipid-A-disaccharide synthase [Marinimicrobium sp. ABcell2]